MQALMTHAVYHRAITISARSKPPLSLVEPYQTRPKLHSPPTSLYTVSKSNFSRTRRYQDPNIPNLRKMLRDTGMSDAQTTRVFEKAEKFAFVATAGVIGLGVWAVIIALKWAFGGSTNGKSKPKKPSNSPS
jgi:hypothetical protein